MLCTDEVDCRSFTQFHWFIFICFVQIGPWWLKSAWISRIESIKKTRQSNGKFESKMEKIRKSNYLHMDCVWCVCVCVPWYVQHVCKFAKQNLSLQRSNGKVDFLCIMQNAHTRCLCSALSTWFRHSNNSTFQSHALLIVKSQSHCGIILASLHFSFVLFKLHKFFALTFCTLACSLHSSLLQEIFNHFNKNPRMLCVCVCIQFFRMADAF